jgi:hypothetical protein
MGRSLLLAISLRAATEDMMKIAIIAAPLVGLIGCAQQLDERSFVDAVKSCGLSSNLDRVIYQCVDDRYPAIQQMTFDHFWARAIRDSYCDAHTLYDTEFRQCVEQYAIAWNTKDGSPEQKEAYRQMIATTHSWELNRYGRIEPCRREDSGGCSP